MDIRHLTQDDFDRQLYNSCVHYAVNGGVYGYDWFLNATAKDWEFIVEVEKERWVTVLPLPYIKNWWGRLRLAQPRLVPELAVYTCKPPSGKRMQAFFDAIPDRFRGGDLLVEPASVPSQPGRFAVAAAGGTALRLDQPYEEIIGDFPPEYHEGLIRAEEADLRPLPSFKPERLADFWLAVNGKTADNEWRYHAMQRIMYQVLHRSWGGTQAVSGPDGEPLAMTFLVYSHGRIFPMFTAESAAGRARGALAYLWDNVLRGHAGKSLKVKREDVGW